MESRRERVLAALRTFAQDFDQSLSAPFEPAVLASVKLFLKACREKCRTQGAELSTHGFELDDLHQAGRP